MLKEEAHWLGQAILSRPAEEVFPLLDVASSGEDFWTREQPWIGEAIWRPVAGRGGEVVHTDMLALPGVDLVGDLYDDAFFETLRAREFRSLVVANLLEHVREPQRLAARLLSLLPAGSLLFVCGPHDYPYHAGPIDTGFRPTVEDMHAMFPGTALIEGRIVRSGTYWEYIDKDAALVARKLARLALPFYKPRGWWTVANHLRWLNRRFSAVCVVLRKS